ncbi:M48 family metalloprotease [Granulosicoccaceae sp. 1_MG-2023]|nr:M48 family metalloprotease [Granulosicoccaceae sp. 1_MG-2023]
MRPNTFALKQGMLLCTALLLVLLSAGTYAARLPDMGEPVDQTLSPADEAEIGRNFWRQANAALPVLRDPELEEYLQSLGERLVAGARSQSYEFRFFLINDPSINAFAVPGGYIGVNTGLIDAFAEEHLLAGVLAHEIAHVTQRHHARAYEAAGTSGLTTAAAILAAIIVGQNSPEAGSAALATGMAVSQQNQINYTRANEYEADRIGIDILASAGFDPAGMAGAFDILNRRNAISRSGSTLQLEYLQTHPLSSNRVAEARNRAAALRTDGARNSRAYSIFRTRMRVIASANRSALEDAYKRNDPDLTNPATRYALALINEQRGDSKEALALLDETQNTTLSEQLLRARAQYGSGQQAQAAAALRELIALYPNRYSPADTLATLLQGDGNYDEAYQILSAYSQRSSNPSLSVWHELASVEAARGHAGLSHEYLATWYARQNLPDEAARQLELALRQPELSGSEKLRIEARLKQLRANAKRG